MIRKIVWILLMLWVSVCTTKAYDGNSQYESFTPDGVPFCVADQTWNPDGVGAHRAVIEVEGKGIQVVRVHLKWRRPDLAPEKKAVVVVHAASGKQVDKIYVESCTAEEGTIWFKPTPAGAGTYYLYYLPHLIVRGYDDFRYKPNWNGYLTYDTDAGTAWRNSLGTTEPVEGRVVRYEAQNNFEFFTSMGNIATTAETNTLRDSHPENPVVFMEDRSFPIRLRHQLPVRWIMNGPKTSFEGTALRNEYYVYQIGLWAAHGALENVRVSFTDLKDAKSGQIIPRSAMTCFNQEGTNWDGTPLSLNISIPDGDIQALWCGIDVPENVASGDYRGEVVVSNDGMAPQTLNVQLHVENTVLADKGDNDLWRLARLRWLNSTLMQDSLPVAPYGPLQVTGEVITSSEKTVHIDRSGLTGSIAVNGREVLAAPVCLEIQTITGDTICMDGGELSMVQQADGLVTWTSEQSKEGLLLKVDGCMEYDGYMHFQIALSSQAGDVEVNDVRLKTVYTTYAQTYMMGIGLSGGYRPKAYKWHWTGPYDSYWIGGVEAGLHVEFRGGSYHGPLLNDYKPNPPAAWENEGRGSIGRCFNRNDKTFLATYTT